MYSRSSTLQPKEFKKKVIVTNPCNPPCARAKKMELVELRLSVPKRKAFLADKDPTQETFFNGSTLGRWKNVIINGTVQWWKNCDCVLGAPPSNYKQHEEVALTA
uniref:Uncharacterized protein n=1 Tax=Parascaris equorum TaxID=6256 RepID=A0A914S9J5_PAREQ